MHFQQNLGCDVATYTISYGSDNPGTQLVAPGLFGLPASGMGEFGVNALGLDSTVLRLRVLQW